MKRVPARVAIAVLGVTALAASASPAAGPKPTPNQRCGAGNMMNVHAAPHMIEAMMEHTAPQGDQGMYDAVLVHSACRT